MRLWSDSFKDGSKFPVEYAFCKFHPALHGEFSRNRSPHLAWEGVPAAAKSLVLVFHDVDAPTRPDHVNQPGRTVPFDLTRADFYHWVLVDIPPETTSLNVGEFSNKVTPKGKSGPEAPHGTRQGMNDFTGWFKGDKVMEGVYFGYDGPCPPWNDERTHHYFFTLYALDIKRCPVEGSFTGPEVLQASADHVLDQAQLSTTYSIYPKAR